VGDALARDVGRDLVEILRELEATAQAIVAAIPEPARQAIRFPDGGFAETDQGFAAAFYADFAPAQAAAIRRAVDLMSQARRS